MLPLDLPQIENPATKLVCILKQKCGSPDKTDGLIKRHDSQLWGFTSRLPLNKGLRIFAD